MFDSGAENSYIASRSVGGLVVARLSAPFSTKLCGGTRKISKICLLEASVFGKRIATKALIVDEIGNDKKAKRPFDVLIGAITMQEWNIELNLKREQLDLSKYSREFIEF